MKERALKIGKPSPLIAIACEGKEFDANKPAVLILNSGVMHHVGACRFSVKLARALAQHNFLSLRFDFSGVGDSETRPGGLDFAEVSSSETIEVMDYLEKKKGIKRFIIYGLCSGADAAYETAIKDSRVEAICQIDPYCYQTPDWFWRHYGPKLFNLQNWLNRLSKLLPQKPQPDNGAAIPKPGTDNIEAAEYLRVFPAKAEVEQNIAALIQRQVHLYSIFTSAQSEILNASGQFAKSFSSIDFGQLLRCEYYADLTHIITEPHYQKLLVDNICQWASDVSR